ncbi:MAG: ATP-binding cassette domain-containing protein [Chloroflexi bacterium]|nr:ATP-binding cassette domain-containing protein [Chloroflexota bacterium]
MDTNTKIIIVILCVVAGLAWRFRQHQRKTRMNLEQHKKELLKQKENYQEPGVNLKTVNDNSSVIDSEPIILHNRGFASSYNLEVSHISKSFNGNVVVNDVSFDVEKSEILGLVGPNGAGKTTTIRMLMDIIKPDSGEIKVFGEKFNEATKNRLGYLPEDRGLYKRLTVAESLTYMAQLKNADKNATEKLATELLQQVNMIQHKYKKNDELSKGMGQLIQFITTVQHNPELIFMDEPFANLDPMNTRLLKDSILQLKKQGKSIILSTHLMNDVEELCDGVLMINRGRIVLYGSLNDVKDKYRNNSVIIESDTIPKNLPGVISVTNHGRHFELFLDNAVEPQEILNILIKNNVKIDKFEISTPSLNEIFIRVAKESR